MQQGSVIIAYDNWKCMKRLTKPLVLNWGSFLCGAKFQVFIDNKSLKYIFTKQDLNLRQTRWWEFIKDDDFSSAYHPGKANVVFNELSWNPLGQLTSMMATQ